MRKLLVLLVASICFAIFSLLQQVPDHITLILDDAEITLNEGEVYETFVDEPIEPILDYPLRSRLTETLSSENIEGVFTYRITIKNWINRTATFTVREHIRLNEALIIVDIQNHYRSYPRIAAVISKVNQLIKEAHDKHVPVIFLKNQALLKDYGITAWELQDALDKQPYDFYLTHEFSNSFNQTGLEKILRYNDIHKLYFAGVGSYSTVTRTAIEALRLNYSVVIISDAHTDQHVTQDFSVEIINNIFYPEPNAMIMISDEIDFEK